MNSISDEQLENKLEQIFVTEFGSVIFVNCTNLMKSNFLIISTNSGIMICFNAGHSVNALLLILVELG